MPLAFCVLSLNIFLSASRYTIPDSVFILVCTHQDYTYLTSSSFRLQLPMAVCRLKLEGPSSFGAMVIHERQVAGTV